MSTQALPSPGQLPQTHRALVLSSITSSIDATVLSTQTPQPTSGSAVIRVLTANVLPYAAAVYDGTRAYPMPTPAVIGSSAIGRVAAIGPDTSTLKVGQLVFADSYIKGRDDKGISFLSGLHEGFTEGSKKLMHGEWRDSTYAEYAKVPLENCFPLDEQRLLGKLGSAEDGLGYTIEDIAYFPRPLVPYGGLVDIRLQAGETIIIAPATGSFGGAAVDAAVAMGATVIAAGRNITALERLAAMNERVKIVQLTMDVETDVKALQKFGIIDAFQDWSPPSAGQTTHIKSCIQALRVGGRVSLMGGIRSDISINYSLVMTHNLEIRGKWMYTREDILSFIKMVETGVLKLGKTKLVGKFPLEQWREAFKAAEENPGHGDLVLIAPGE